MKKTMGGDLERVAFRLAEILGDDGVLVGALAVAAHGFIRATSDVDLWLRGFPWLRSAVAWRSTVSPRRSIEVISTFSGARWAGCASTS